MAGGSGRGSLQMARTAQSPAFQERNSFLKRLANVTQIFYICISVISGMNSTKLNPDIKVFFFQLFLLKSYWVLILFLSYCKLFGYCIFGCKYNLVYI